MQVSPQTQAVLLLTAHFSKPRPDDVRPLTPTEWGRFAEWLRREKKAPESLLSGDLGETLKTWSDRQVTEDRVARLLDRGSALAIAMDKWQRSGLWVLARSDSAYPRKLKRRLRATSPPVLFGCGNTDILNHAGLAVVGSRNASPADLDYADKLGVAAAEAGFAIMSGGARGIDEAAMLGALRVGGTAAGVLADSLLRAASSQKYRDHLLRNNLALISPYYPEAGFNTGNAMGRNKYIYCLSDAAVVVHSGRRGGTWNGALENLRRDWVPLWVKPTKDSSAGNAEIVRNGGWWGPETIPPGQGLGFLELRADRPSPGHDDLFEPAVREPTPPGQPTSDRDAVVANTGTGSDVSFYELFLQKLAHACSDGPLSPDELADRLELQKTQLNAWLKQALSEKRVEKLTRPVRYQWRGGDVQRSMFERTEPDADR